jgi:AraC family transcriptional regulator
MESIGISPVRAVEVIRDGHRTSPILIPAAVSSRRVEWNGIALEAFHDVPASNIPEHEHPTHFLNLFTSGRIRAQWTMDGRTRTADHGPGTLYLLPAGSRDLATWSGPNSRILLVMEPRFLAGVLDETAHLADVELRPNLSFQDRHIVAILRALHADLEDGSPAGPLYGQSLSVALAHYFIRRYAVRTTHDPEYRNGMPAVRLNRVLDFMRQNYAKETRLWELANLAGMSPHYFCELFKQSTGISPYQYSLRCRMDRAKEFLRSPQFTVRQVAEATGFADQSHFTKVFRRMVGVTPLQFRVNRPNIGFSRQLRAECA